MSLKFLVGIFLAAILTENFVFILPSINTTLIVF